MEFQIKQIESKILQSSSIQEAAKFKKEFLDFFVLPLQKSMISASKEERSEIGKKINFLKNIAISAFDKVKHKFENEFLDIPDLDPILENPRFKSYSFNPLSEVRKDLIYLFNDLGFFIETGDEVVSVQNNFEDLLIPKDHPSRSKSETFYVSEEEILRPHCTVNSVKFLISQKLKKSIRIATIGNVYRKDDESTRHTHQFSQLDFLWVDKNLNVGNLKWLLKIIFNRLFGFKQQYRFRNSYFPFTQPSFEMDMKCFCNCKEDCVLCKNTGWIEVLGAGMFKKEILENAGYDVHYEALAGGIGLERVALIKYGITDIRKIYENNFDFLKDDN